MPIKRKKLKKLKKVKMKDVLQLKTPKDISLEQQCKELFDLIKDSSDILKIETYKYFAIKK